MYRLIAFMSILIAIFLAAGFLLGGVFGLTVAFILALFINFFSYYNSSGIMLKAYGAGPSQNKELNRIVDDLAREAKIPTPRVYIIKKDVPNAFATGRNERHAAVAITEGLLVLNREEIESVVAHEISHIKKRDIQISTIAAIIGGAISYVAQIAYWSLIFDENRKGKPVGVFLIALFAPLAAFIVRMAISRSMEYRADHSAAMMTKNPRALASALRKISDTARHKPMKGPPASSHLWIINPFRRDWFTSLFSTHPPIARRVKRLEDMYHEGIPQPPLID
jgi:heat shock protein HtpX